VPPTDLGGAALPELALDGLVFRHMPTGRLAGEIAGHLHPKARVATRRLNLSRACFVADEERLLLPAFGSFTGGLNILDPAIMSLFPSGCSAFLLGERQVFRFPSHVLAREPAAPRHRAS
jgi:metallophosphoesterase superfamily enzyme